MCRKRSPNVKIFPWLLYVRKKRSIAISEIYIFTNYFYERTKDLASRALLPPFDERKATKLVEMHTLQRHAIFDLECREWQSSLSSSRTESTISFNFPVMRMKHGALRGFEGANAANRYATSNSSSASEPKQGNRRERGRKDRWRKGAEREEEKLYTCVGKKGLESVKMAEQVDIRKYALARIEEKQAYKSDGRARGECEIFRGLVG